MDISQLAGTDYQDMPLAGNIYRVGVLTLREWAPVQAWIKANSPRPISTIRSEDLAGLSAADRAHILAIAYKETLAWPPRLVSPAWFLALDAPGGHAVLLLALLGKHQPDLKLEACAAIAEAVEDITEVLRMVVVGMGGDPSPKSGAPGRKSAERKNRRPPPTTSARSRSKSPKPGAGPRTSS